MTTELYKICNLGGGCLSVMPKPDSEQMQRDIEFYHSQGVTKVISLLLPSEIDKLAMHMEPKVCQQYDIEFVNFSIKDMSVPTLTELKDFNTRLKQDLLQGHHLAIHCHGGRGRAGIVAITLMVEHGIDANKAMQMAQQARGDKIPVNDLQTEFVLNYPV